MCDIRHLSVHWNR